MKRVSVFFLLLCLIGLTLMNIPSINATTWFDPSWAYRKSHLIINSTGAGINYQIRIKTYFGSGSDIGESVYLNDHAQSDFDDVRFTEDDGLTLLDYWRQEYTPDVSAVFWVEISGDLSSTNQTIYVYYGNDAVSTISNGANTFLVFDEFDADNWSDLGGATHSVAGGQISVSDSGSEGVVYRNVALPNGIVFTWEHISSSTGFWGTFLIHNNGVNVPSGYMVDLGTGAYSVYYGDGGAWNAFGGTVGGCAKGTVVELHRYGTTLKLYVDGVLKTTRTHATLTGGRVGFRQVASRNKVIDRVRVRKRVDPDPQHDVWGEEEENLVYVTFYNTTGGILRINNATVNNGTQIGYANETTIELIALVEGNATYVFNNFTWDSNANISNPSLLIIPSNLTVWCYFSVPEGGYGGFVFLFFGLVIGLVVGALVVFGSKR